MTTFTISPATSELDLQNIKKLFEAYAQSLGIDLTFQDFARELEGLPGKYSPPNGALLLARSNETAESIGCVALRPLPATQTSATTHEATNVYDSLATRSRSTISEMKRLYVSPAGRGTGVGKALAVRVVQEAKDLGFEAIRLDTLPSMEAARALYRALGFREIEAYYETPLEGTIFLELTLR
ncbi:hypothetical protein LTR78_004374 [Recurvomyces mirabilis]|uniref:N-acetyltransferase domain-containing protein n=1 Tax=Recurvomyces mirabilis TaxID=574656 RepID=A0AAE0WPY4_9PEZI|nr:hypothetical protein LTR78_004374 [Recurvomyces mirabilis]